MAKGKYLSSSFVARVGVLGAISAILFFFPEIPVIGFYKLDFSTLPALLGGFAMGPWAGLLIVLIKDIVGMLHSSSAFVGELADFLCSGIFVIIASTWYRKNKTFVGALSGMAAGTFAMAIVGALSNYYIMIPFYIGQMSFSEADIIGAFSTTFPAIDSLFKLILYITVPFNFLKGVVLSLLTLLLYKRLSGLLHGKRA